MSRYKHTASKLKKYYCEYETEIDSYVVLDPRCPAEHRVITDEASFTLSRIKDYFPGEKDIEMEVADAMNELDSLREENEKLKDQVADWGNKT